MCKVPFAKYKSSSRIGGTHLMGTESRVVQFFNGVLHILVTQKLHDSRTIFVGVGKANISGLTHVILQVLPRAWTWQASYHDTVLWALSWGSSATHAATAIPATIVPIVAAVATWTTTARELDSQTIPVIVISITRFDSIIGITVCRRNERLILC